LTIRKSSTVSIIIQKRLPSSSAVKASVILPTKDRGILIEKTIDSLLSLDFLSTDFEILLIDNLSSTANQKHLRSLQAQYPDRIRYIREIKLGLNNARNCGIVNAQGEILVFLDDDALVPTYWLANIVKYFDRDDRVYALGGKVIAQFTSPAPDWIDLRLGLYISNFDRGEQPEKLFYNEYPRGANMAFRREAFQQFGLFRDCFDRKGKSLMSYGDIEMCYRLDRGGFTVLYVPDAEVWHLIRGDRLNEAWFQKRFYWQGRSEGLFELLHYGRKHALKNFAEHWRKSQEGDSYDRLLHRGFVDATILNFLRLSFK
jgi:GT2 family glycosyltransferase